MTTEQTHDKALKPEAGDDEVERVAKAIRLHDHDSDKCPSLDEMECYRKMARAAMDAMRTIAPVSKHLIDEFLEQPDIAEQWEEFKRDNGRNGVGA